MKFTQNEAAKKISAILTRGGKDLQMSERSINENLDSLMKMLVTDETEIDDFIAKVRPMFETMNANAKKDYSDFVNKWKEEHPESEPSTEKKPPQNKANPELEAALERIAALEKDKEESSKRASIAQKRKDLASKLKEKGVKDDEWMSDFLSEVNITEDFDVDGKVETYVKLYNKSQASGGGAPAPLNPKGSPVNDSFKQSIKAAAEMAKRDRATIEAKN